MSFGFSIGDFIAISELASRLYKDIYLVARRAPQELVQLQNEVATLSMSIDLLVAEVQDGNSTLARSGKDRVEIVNSVLRDTNKTLLELEKLCTTFNLGNRKPSVLGKIVSTWEKARFAKDLPKVDALRARLQYENGTINLLLVSAGNSSLERVETMDRKMNADIEALTKMMTQLTHQHLDDSSNFQSPLTEKFLEEAERGGRRWFSFGFDEWLQAGKWWLMSFQRGNSTGISDGIIHAQAYADLLKASSILLDVLPRHPSIRLWDPTKEYLQFRLLAKMLRNELDTIEARVLRKPDMDDVLNSDLRIWMDTVNTFQLQPGMKAVNSMFWDVAGEETLFQGFGTFTYDRQVDPESCLILVLVSKKNIDQARLVALNQRGTELTAVRIDFGLLREKQILGHGFIDRLESWQCIKTQDIYCTRALGDGNNTIRFGQIEFRLSSPAMLGGLSAVIRGLLSCQTIRGFPQNHSLLHAMILLFQVTYGNKDILKVSLNSNQDRPCSDYSSDETESIFQLAMSAASAILDNKWKFGPEKPILADAIVPCPQLSAYTPEDESQCIYYWFFDILTTLAALGLPVDHFRPIMLPTNSNFDRDGRRNYDSPVDLYLLSGIAELAIIFNNNLLFEALSNDDLNVNQIRDDGKWSMTNHLLSDWDAKSVLAWSSRSRLHCNLLHYAAAYSSHTTVQTLLDLGSDPMRQTEGRIYGFLSAFECALVTSNTGVVQSFVSPREPAKLLSCALRFYSGVRVTAQDKKNYCRMIRVIVKCVLDLYIVKYGSEFGMRMFKAEVGNVLLVDAISRGEAEFIDWAFGVFFEMDLACKSLLDYMRTLNLLNQTPLWFACFARELDVVQTLLAKSIAAGVDSGHEDHKSWVSTPLKALVRVSSEPFSNPDVTVDSAIVSTLCEAGALLDLSTYTPTTDVQEQQGHGTTPLLAALICRNIAIAQVFVNAGATVDNAAKAVRNDILEGIKGPFADSVSDGLMIEITPSSRRPMSLLSTTKIPMNSAVDWLLNDVVWAGESTEKTPPAAELLVEGEAPD
ncbi:hypothetical protein B7494_g3230 [Chlorociboria aeruginascens]|nr:hypothetical protein B7494_g3230 [Chlorociboria aeruginascens]